MYKKILICICLSVLAATGVHGKVVFQESFSGLNGEPGQLSAGPKDSMEFYNDQGFVIAYEETRWWTYSGGNGSSPKYIQIEEGSLSYPGYRTTGEGNKVHLWSSDADDVRSFASESVSEGKVYMGAIIRVEQLKAKTDADYFLSLGDHANSYYTGRLYAKSVKEGEEWTGFRLGIAKNNESTTFIAFTDEVYSVGTDYLVVLEYEFVPGAKNDTVRLYVNPEKANAVPTLVCRQEATTGYGSPAGANAKEDAHQIFGVFLRQGLNTPKVFIDEITVATEWGELWEEDTDPIGTGIESGLPSAAYSKTIRDGQLVITREGKQYTATGSAIR